MCGMRCVWELGWEVRVGRDGCAPGGDECWTKLSEALRARLALPVGAAAAPTGLPLGACRAPTGLPLGSHWDPTGIPLGVSAAPTGLPLGSHWE